MMQWGMRKKAYSKLCDKMESLCDLIVRKIVSIVKLLP